MIRHRDPLAPGTDEEIELPSVPEETVRQFPPSAKLVSKVLEHEGPMTQKELTGATRLSQRTVRDATKRLEAEGIVQRRIYIPDARQSLYSLNVVLP